MAENRGERWMEVVNQIASVRDRLKQNRHKKIGLVPTMGYLHEGHLSLIREAKANCEVVVLSVFVNPLQFGPGEDLSRYPRDLQRDIQVAKEAGADLLFAPSVEEMYPHPPLTQVQVKGLTEPLCGSSRPGHFDGVTTVVAKLLHIVEPDHIYFGQKDAQQAAVIQRMVEDLHFPVHMVTCPTVREEDGLAMSSRNVYLTPEERSQATILYRSLSEGEKLWRQGHWLNSKDIVSFIEDQIQTQPLAKIDYVQVLHFPDLEPVHELTGSTLIVAVAVYFGKTRLIDNMIWN